MATIWDWNILVSKHMVNLCLLNIDIVSSQLYVCHILVSKKCQLQELLTQQLTGSSTQTQPCDNAMSMLLNKWNTDVTATPPVNPL